MPVFNAPPGSSDSDVSFERKATQMEIREMMCEEEFAAAAGETSSPAGREDANRDAGRGDEVVHIDNAVHVDNVVPGNDIHPTFTIFRDDDDALPSIPQLTRRQPSTQVFALHRVDEDHHHHHYRASQASQATATGTATFTPHTHTHTRSRSKPQSPTKHTHDCTQAQTPAPHPSLAPAPATAAVPTGQPPRPPQNEPENENENDENVLPSDCASLLQQLEHLAATRRALLARVSRIEAEERSVLDRLGRALEALVAGEQSVRNGMEVLTQAGVLDGVVGKDLEGNADGDVAVAVAVGEDNKDTTTRALPVCGSATPLTTPTCTLPTHSSQASRSSLSASRSRIPVPVLDASSPPVPAHQPSFTQPSFTAPTFTSERRRRLRYSEDDSKDGREGGVGVKSMKRSTTTTCNTTTTTAFLPLKIGRGRGRAAQQLAQLPKDGRMGVSMSGSQVRSVSRSGSQIGLRRDGSPMTSRRENKTTSKSTIGSARAGGRRTKATVTGAVPGRVTQTEIATQISDTTERVEYAVPRTVARKEWAF
ncbi:hypothetical protein IQ07DRAFT_654937 [Pyrenochaeta sp. DS3sAY3a]|nr:hypothetical protein IQ07DRAFT_654937 [Pyrenochaeta sp. DS3sAY3a]